MTAVIEIQDVWKIYQQRRVEVQALRGVSLTLNSGEMVAITGASGSGKSTLLHVMGALDTPTRGDLKILGEDVVSYKDDKLAAFRRRHLGFVFQFFNLLPTMTARENVALPLLLDGVSRSEAFKRADELLDQVGLAARLDHRPDELSGGQQQRVAVARALVAKPQILLADEPTGNLDSTASEEILNLLNQMRQETGLTLVLVTHDDHIAATAPKNIILSDGQIAEVRSPSSDVDSANSDSIDR